MKQKLIDSITKRLKEEVAPQNPIKFLHTLDIEEIVEIAVSTIYVYTRMTRGSGKKTVYLTEVISAIGHNIRNRYKIKKDSAIAAKAGAFILYSFEAIGLLSVVLGQGPNGHAAYIITINDEESLGALWDNLDVTKIEKLPAEKPYAPWTSTRHLTGVSMIKTFNVNVLSAITPETHPIVYDCINKAQEIGYRINEDVFNIHTWALRNRTDAFSNIWDLQNPEARASKLREAMAIGSIAKRFLGRAFYHLYYYDFRGRRYPATAYLHEQGSDLAKGLLLRDDKKVVGKEGFHWLLISIASNWAGSAGRDDGAKTDKIPLKDRINWALDNEEILLSYAESPKVNQGWMHADKPWQFLAGCFELMKLRIWQANNWQWNGKDYGEPIDKYMEDFNYESGFQAFIDGSNNGSQHLSALTKDEITAPHVNLVPLDLPGDLYKYVAEHVWNNLEAIVDGMSKTERNECETLIDNIIDLKKQISEAQMKSERRKELVSTIMSLKSSKKDIIDKASPVYWMRITDLKQRRKIVKRNVMTLPYGGTAYGLG